MNIDLLDRVFNPENSKKSTSLLQSALSHSKASFQDNWNELLESNVLPSRGWSDAAIQAFLLELSAMDANNFDNSVGMGEREGRIHNKVVRNRHFG